MIRKPRIVTFLKILTLIYAIYIVLPLLSNSVELSQALKPHDNESVRRFIEKLQHPEDCDSARKLVCPLTPACGFGCITHKLVNCFIYAAWTNRTVVLYPFPGPIITKEGWEHYFLPISENCTSYGRPEKWGPDHAQHQVVKVDSHRVAPTPGLEEWEEAPPPWVQAPSSVESPMAWWVGHIVQYIYRLQPGMAEHVRVAKESIGFVEPIPGMQVRRTDKKRETEYVPVEAYMPSIERYYGNQKKGTLKRVYLATDEPAVVRELQTKYPDYTFLSDSATVSAASNFTQNSRFSSENHLGIITDIQLLLSCEFVVCTLSSNIGRLVYEVHSSRLWDVSETFHSADQAYKYL